MQSQYHNHKREAFESFIGFTEGREMPRWPLEIFLEVSNICDLKCAMCPTFSALNSHRFENLRSHDRGVMDVEQAMTSLDDLLKYAPVVHAHGYGEPTIHPKFREMIDGLSEYEVMVDFFTNGMHLDTELCEFLVSRRVARITVSFSGASADEYENVYIGGKFEQVLQGIDNLNAAKKRANAAFPKIEVNSIGFKHHIASLPDFVQMMGERGVDTIHLKPLSTYGKIPELHAHKSGMRADVEGQILREAQKVALKYDLNLASKPFENQVPEATKAEEEAEVLAITDLKNIAKSVDMSKEKLDKITTLYDPQADAEVHLDATPCMEPFKTLYVQYGGDVFPCCFKGSHQGVASLEASGSESIWNASGLEHMRERALEGGYARKMCGICIKKSTYPKHHHVNFTISHYANWYESSFGKPFDAQVRAKGKGLAKNEEIVRRWAEGPDSPLASRLSDLRNRFPLERLTTAAVLRRGRRAMGSAKALLSGNKRR